LYSINILKRFLLFLLIVFPAFMPSSRSIKKLDPSTVNARHSFGSSSATTTTADFHQAPTARHVHGTNHTATAPSNSSFSSSSSAVSTSSTWFQSLVQVVTPAATGLWQLSQRVWNSVGQEIANIKREYQNGVGF
jgi:hypothetical protein